MRFVEGCLNLEFIELNLSLDYEIVINRVVDFGLGKNWENLHLCERRGAHHRRFEGRGAAHKKLIVGN